MKVLVSEWSRNAAHNLDDRRSAWVATRAATSFIEEGLLSLKVRDDIDHASLFSLKAYAIAMLIADITHDRGKVQDHLSKLKSTKAINGISYPKHVMDNYRRSVVEHLHYLEALSSVLKALRRNYEWEHSFREAEHLSDMSEVEMISRLYFMFKKYAGEFGWWQQITDDDQVFLDAIVSMLRIKAI